MTAEHGQRELDGLVALRPDELLDRAVRIVELVDHLRGVDVGAERVVDEIDGVGDVPVGFLEQVGDLRSDERADRGDEQQEREQHAEQDGDGRSSAPPSPCGEPVDAGFDGRARGTATRAAGRAATTAGGTRDGTRTSGRSRPRTRRPRERPNAAWSDRSLDGPRAGRTGRPLRRAGSRSRSRSRHRRRSHWHRRQLLRRRRHGRPNHRAHSMVSSGTTGSYSCAVGAWAQW